MYLPMSDLPSTLAPSAPMACPTRLRLDRVGLPRSTWLGLGFALGLGLG